ncbi:hypothetical protein V2J09_024208 [Rumex salicifolius]
MESILARALEYTLKYWLKSFSRDQFKLQGRTAQLSNLDINGDALHSSMGLPPALNVTTARVGKLEIALPSISSVQVEPIVVQIDRLDLVLEENSDPDACSNAGCSPSASSSAAKGNGYGFADKIADGMTVEVGTVNLLLETRGGAHCHEGATWTPPMASITIKGLVVNLKEARDFSSNKKFIYLFKKLEWDSLSIDLLPHPDMFMDARFSEEGANKRDDDGAKRVFFGGERFLEGISGEANITVKRTELNNPLGLEVQLHISEAVCPALSEPGLRALLRFLTGLYVCLSRGDVDPKSQQRSTEAAGCSLVSIIVDHIFFCIKDTEFRLELLMQSVCFSRASVSDGEDSINLTQVAVGGLFLRDTFSHPPCTLFQPSMHDFTGDSKPVPDFAKSCCPDIYPLGDQQFQSETSVPFISIYSLQVNPTPLPPQFASQTAIFCQPLLMHLQEESCFRISSFLADGVVAGRGTVLPDFSINSLKVSLKELDIMVPLKTGKLGTLASNKDNALSRTFTGARLCMKNLLFMESPSLKMLLLFLEKDPACFSLWEGQPIDASQKKWSASASFLSLSLEANDGLKKGSSGLWKCVELKDVSIEVAMATPDGKPLIRVPPPGGIVRVGVACKQYLSNTSVQQLFFLLDLYAYFGSISEKMSIVGGESNKASILETDQSWSGELMSNMPSDTAMSLSVEDQQVRFLEDFPNSSIQGKPLLQFVGMDLFVKVTHRTLGGASAISSTLRWESIEVDCVDHMEKNITFDNETKSYSQSDDLRAVLWINNKGKKRSGVSSSDLPFFNVSMTHVVPFEAQDAECHSFTLSACMAGIRLGGGMNYTERLLRRFGVLGPDGKPRKEISKGLQNLSAGPLSKIFKPSPLISKDIKENGTHENVNDTIFPHLGHPDDVDVCIDLKDWLFALEGAEEMSNAWLDKHESTIREERCWHSTFRNLRIKAKNIHKTRLNGTMKWHVMRKYPVDFITVGVEGLQTLKPQVQILDLLAGTPVNGVQKKPTETPGGVNFEACMVASESDYDFQTENWEVEKLMFSVDNPIEAVITKDELQHLTSLCKTEVDSIGRISAGILRLLKLEATFGQEALDQLNNLGSGGFDKLISSKKLHEANRPSLQSMVTAMEEEVKDSRMKCADLIADIGDAEPSLQHVDKIKELESRLEGMQRLLKQLRTEG